MSDSKDLFHGITIVIDDEIGQNKQIDSIVQEIIRADCHVVTLSSLPEEAAVKNFSGASFIILDWDFSSVAPDAKIAGVTVGSTLKAEQEHGNVSFLRRLNDDLFIPVFLFTNTDVKHVKEILISEGLIEDDDGDHIFVMDKQSVIDKGLFNILKEWVENHPSAYALKKWEQTYTTSKNSIFKEFYKNSRYWPIVLWDAYSEDSISPEPALCKLIATNINSRTKPADFDHEILAKMHQDKMKIIKRDEIHKVLLGERFISDDFLDKDSYSLGDLFYYKSRGKKRFFINIRPECDCVARDGIADVTLYLLQGRVLDKLELDANKVVIEREVWSIITSLHDGDHIKFDFKNLHVMPASELAKLNFQRIGRLIPPHITRMVQRYASYTQRTALPKVPTMILD